METSEPKPMKNCSYLLLSSLLSLAFVYAGFIKALGTASFYQNIRAYHLLPDQWAWTSAHYLPWLEIVAGVALLARRTRFASGLIIAILLIVFMAALLSAWTRGINIECGCFGEEGSPSNYVWYLSRDAIMFLVALYVLGSALKQHIERPLNL